MEETKANGAEMARASKQERKSETTTINLRESLWFYERCLDSMENFFENYRGEVKDSDIFYNLGKARNSTDALIKSICDSDEWPDDVKKLLSKWLSGELSQVRVREPRPGDRDVEPCGDGDCPNGMQGDVPRRVESTLQVTLDRMLGCGGEFREILATLWNHENYRSAAISTIRALICHARKNPPTHLVDDRDGGIIERRFREMREFFQLDDVEAGILQAVAQFDYGLFCRPSPDLKGYAGRCTMIAAMLGVDLSSVLERTSSSSKIRKYMILDRDLDPYFALSAWISGSSDALFMNQFYYLDEETPIAWKNFSHLTEKHGAILKRMLGRKFGRPVKILLYGAPGSGKTSFARALAKEVGRRMNFIRQSVSESDEQTRSKPEFRMAAVVAANLRLSSDPDRNLIVVDEADSMLKCSPGMLFGKDGSESPSGDKGLLNAMLDCLAVPSIWITNTPAEVLDESNRRRFDYSICFEQLNCEQRKAIWKNAIRMLGCQSLFTAAQIEKFSAEYPVSAGGITLVMENLARMKPRKAEVPALVERLMKPHCELMGISPKDDKMLPSKDYTLEGLNLRGEIELPRIIEAVRAFQNRRGPADPDRPRMNLLLSGPPGTGKTEFVKYLASVLRTKVNVRMGSDLLSMWVGGTEQNIRRAFAQAEDEHAILFLDEIDGLVQNRAGAHASWEVTQVNELLHQMENFDGVMIGATNFVRNLDGAIHRRFTFKLEFDYLDDAGKELFFEKMFHCQLSPEAKARLRRIPNLAPGDFRTVRQSLFYYGGASSMEDYLCAIEREAETKKTYGYFGTGTGRIGFS